MFALREGGEEGGASKCKHIRAEGRGAYNNANVHILYFFLTEHLVNELLITITRLYARNRKQAA